MIFACSLIELYQLGGWYLMPTMVTYIYMTNDYNLMQALNFGTNNLDKDMDLYT